MTFAARKALNIDEFCLFYHQPPVWILSKGLVFEQKKDKTRLTFLAYRNADESEKLPLMIIGSALQARAFMKKSGEQLGFDYHEKIKV